MGEQRPDLTRDWIVRTLWFHPLVFSGLARNRKRNFGIQVNYGFDSLDLPGMIFGADACQVGGDIAGKDDYSTVGLNGNGRGREGRILLDSGLHVSGDRRVGALVRAGNQSGKGQKQGCEEGEIPGIHRCSVATSCKSGFGSGITECGESACPRTK
jgi:hypothetical protein